MIKKIFITGGAGCLGTSIIERYLPKEYQIMVLDNYVTGKKQNFPAGLNGLTIIEGSVADSVLVDELIGKFKPDVIINSAASYKDPDDWQEDVGTNILGSVHVAKACLKYGIHKLINFQTALCYGRPDRVPIPASAPTRPFTSYGISKTAGEQYLLSSGLNVISLRLANICGPRLAIGPIPTFYTRLKDQKNCFCSDSIRDFLDMEDFLDILDIAIRKEIPTGVYNVSTGIGSSIKDVFDAVVEHLKILAPEVPIVPVSADDVSTVVLDPGQTKSVFGWEPKFNFKQTIKRQLDWYDTYGVTDIYSHLSVPKQ